MTLLLVGTYRGPVPTCSHCGDHGRGWVGPYEGLGGAQLIACLPCARRILEKRGRL